ncbi:hypothetical protein [Sporisorium scitamineum]|uniref:Uncharacterized protein n=1 Tax=Sporisorium scitamineum TaxID=49012 RepID=A0A0F7S8Q6_9BASI|nr:hypothetical protein [Sporisorium scitamineum]
MLAWIFRRAQAWGSPPSLDKAGNALSGMAFGAHQAGSCRLSPCLATAAAAAAAPDQQGRTNTKSVRAPIFGSASSSSYPILLLPLPGSTA